MIQDSSDAHDSQLREQFIFLYDTYVNRYKKRKEKEIKKKEEREIAKKEGLPDESSLQATKLPTDYTSLLELSYRYFSTTTSDNFPSSTFENIENNQKKEIDNDGHNLTTSGEGIGTSDAGCDNDSSYGSHVIVVPVQVSLLPHKIRFPKETISLSLSNIALSIYIDIDIDIDIDIYVEGEK
tara:strand:+ start:2192 stop:2737 length:546 start_codon:yes stop_codon:yes gene_type:complete